MPQVDRLNGILVDIPDGVDVADVLAEPRRRRSSRRGGLPGVDALPDIDSALAGAEFTVLDTFALVTAPGPTGRRRRGPAAAGQGSIAVDLPTEDSAVVLVEEDGYFTWHLPSGEEAIGARRRRGGAPTDAVKRLRFDLDLGTTASPGRRRGIPILGGVIGKATARVLRFVLPPVIGSVIQHMERNRHTGLVAMDALAPSSWISAPQPPSIPPGRRSSALLFLHGTFSSTRGGFGALGATPWGQELLSKARERYDTVLGYDHKTLSVDPRQNAAALLAELRRTWPEGNVDFDVICHSRGGLVYRSLVEGVLPADPWPGTFGRAIFVAAANSGTELANAENWDRLADLYTNLAAMAARGLAIIVPGAQAAALVLAELLDGVGTLVKTIVARSLVSADIPGLAAMQPNGPFIQALNANTPGGPVADTSNYYAVTSNFSADLRAPDKEIGEKLLTLLKDGLVDQLMQADNDMVVDLLSMTKIDPGAGDFFDERLDFGENGAVYHTNYFHQPETGRAIGQWLGFNAEARAGPRRRGTRRPAPTMPIAATPDFMVLNVGQPFDNQLIDELNARPAAYIVIDRYPDVRYAFRRDELRVAFDAAAERRMAGAPLEIALDLNEGDRSTLTRDGQVIAQARTGGPPTTGRTVVLVGVTPVGIIPSPKDAMTAEQLAELAAGTPFRRPEPILHAGPPPSGEDPPGLGMANGEGAGHGAAAPRRRRTRGGTRAETGAEPASPQATSVALNAGAWTDAQLEIEQAATLTVSLSRGEVEVPGNTASGRARIAAADPNQPLIVMVFGRRNVRVTGKSTQKTPIPAAESDPTELYFDIVGTDLGAAQLDVIIRQAEAPLAKITLMPEVVQLVAGGRRAEGTATVTTTAEPGPARHQLYISEEQHGAETRYRFHLELLRPGEPPQPVVAESEPISGNKEDYVRDLYKRIEDMWGDTRDQIDQFTDQMRAEGGTLWDDLIPRDIQDQLWANRNEIGFIQVYSDEPFIPWELVHMKEPGRRTLPRESWFLAELGLVRWMMPADGGLGCNRAPRSLRVRPGKVCALVPDYPQQSGWNLESSPAELATLESNFGSVQRVPATYSAVKDLLAAGDFDIFHYAGHGIGDSTRIGDEALVLGVSRDGATWLPETSFRAADVANHAALAPTPCAEHRPIVMLNCCETGRTGYTLTSVGGLASAFLGAGAGVVISPLWSVDDVAAAGFSKAFYESLKSGATLAEAARTARAAIKDAGDQTWLAYTVYGEPTSRLT